MSVHAINWHRAMNNGEMVKLAARCLSGNKAHRESHLAGVAQHLRFVSIFDELDFTLYKMFGLSPYRA